MTGLNDALEAVRAAVYAENARGGEARMVVFDVARILGVDLFRDVRGGDLWSPENMARVVTAAERWVRNPLRVGQWEPSP